MSPPNELTRVIHAWMEIYMHRSIHDFKHFMKETNLSFSQISVLMRLKHGGCAGVSEVGEQMGATPAAASQAVDRLVNLGLIERTEDPQDRRSKRLELTAKGHALMEEGIRVRSQWMEGLAKTLTPQQQDMIIPALTLLIEAAQKMDE